MKTSTFIIRFLAAVMLSIWASGADACAQETDPGRFPLPDIPESMTNLYERSNYLVEHYWDRAPWKSAFSSLKDMDEAFERYLDILPLASREVVHSSLDSFLKNVSKNPAGMKFIADLAGKYLYSDSALYTSDEIYAKILKAAVSTKKIDKSASARYAKILSRVEGCPLGGVIAPIAVTLPDGTTSDLLKISADTPYTIIFITDPAAPGHPLSRLRLDADSRLGRFIADGIVTMVALYPREADQSWKSEAASLPAQWIAVSSPEAESRLDMRETPSFCVIDNTGTVIHKNISTDRLLDLIYSIK